MSPLERIRLLINRCESSGEDPTVDKPLWDPLERIRLLINHCEASGEDPAVDKPLWVLWGEDLTVDKPLWVLWRGSTKVKIPRFHQSSMFTLVKVDAGVLFPSKDNYFRFMIFMFVRRGSHRDRVRPYIYPYTEGTWLSLVLELFFKGDQFDLAIVTPAMHPTVQSTNFRL